MLNSMTAYGRATAQSGGKDYVVELKSVNSRYFDCGIRLPKMYGFLEDKIKSHIQSRGVSRGKVDVYIGIDVVDSAGVELNIDETYAASYITALRTLRDKFCLTDDITVMSVAQNRDVFTVKKPDEDIERDWTELKPILDEALDRYNEARSAEGQNLAADMLKKMARVRELAEKIAAVSKTNTESYMGRLETRLRQTLAALDVETDSERILTECAIFADKIAVDEEVVRLRSHFEAFGRAVDSDEPVGRRIDFLLQEINREINTIGSKSNDAEIAGMVVDAKCELEKIREQIQNIE